MRGRGVKEEGEVVRGICVTREYACVVSGCVCVHVCVPHNIHSNIIFLGFEYCGGQMNSRCRCWGAGKTR